MDVINDVRRLTQTSLSRLRELIGANRLSAVLGAVALLVVVGAFVVFRAPSGTAGPAKPIAVAIVPTVASAPRQEPSATASENSPTTADDSSGTPTPLPTFVDENLPSPTSVGLSTPIITPDSTAPPTSVALSATPRPAVTPNAAITGPAPAHLAAGPMQLQIPKIGVKASIEPVGVDRSGAMATPSGPFMVGWWDQGAVPGDPGNAVLDGHLDSAKVGAAVFWRLGDLRAGDQIMVKMPGNRTLTFIVDRSAVYAFNNAPLLDIFGPASTPSLNLITCSGSFDRTSKNYDRRLVVYSHLRKS